MVGATGATSAKSGANKKASRICELAFTRPGLIWQELTLR